MCVVGVQLHILDLWCVCTLHRAENYWTTVLLSLMQCAHTPQVQNMPPNTNHAHNKHIWTIICNFSQVEVISPWWWILCDPKHVGVIFNVSFRLLYNKILMSMTVIIECNSWLINVTDKPMCIQNSLQYSELLHTILNLQILL